MNKAANPANQVMFYDPFAEYLGRFRALEFDSEDMLLTYMPDDRRTILAILADDTRAGDLEKRMSKLKPGSEDPFLPGDHFLSRPTSDETGSFNYSLVFLLDADEAKHLTGKKPALKNMIELSCQDREIKAVPIGYATLQVIFRKLGEMEGAEDCELDEYSLELNFKAAFLDARYRRKGLGRFVSAVLADGVKASLSRLNNLSTAYGSSIKLDIASHFEIHSEGGEAAADTFNSEIEETMDLYCVDGKTGLTVREFEEDGGW